MNISKKIVEKLKTNHEKPKVEVEKFEIWIDHKNYSNSSTMLILCFPPSYVRNPPDYLVCCPCSSSPILVHNLRNGLLEAELGTFDHKMMIRWEDDSILALRKNHIVDCFQIRKPMNWRTKPICEIDCIASHLNENSTYTSDNSIMGIMKVSSKRGTFIAVTRKNIYVVSLPEDKIMKEFVIPWRFSHSYYWGSNSSFSKMSKKNRSEFYMAKNSSSYEVVRYNFDSEKICDFYMFHNGQVSGIQTFLSNQFGVETEVLVIKLRYGNASNVFYLYNTNSGSCRRYLRFGKPNKGYGVRYLDNGYLFGYSNSSINFLYLGNSTQLLCPYHYHLRYTDQMILNYEVANFEESGILSCSIVGMDFENKELRIALYTKSNQLRKSKIMFMKIKGLKYLEKPWELKRTSVENKTDLMERISFLNDDHEEGYFDIGKFTIIMNFLNSQVNLKVQKFFLMK